MKKEKAKKDGKEKFKKKLNGKKSSGCVYAPLMRGCKREDGGGEGHTLPPWANLKHKIQKFPQKGRSESV
jgi:hypothetical protein